LYNLYYENIKIELLLILINPYKITMLPFYNEDMNVIEIGIDEVGRGPLFGRVYAAAVILPKDSEAFDHSKMKDSKKFSSKKKLLEAAEYIKQNAIAWSVQFEDEKTIDNINILQATQQCMHKCIKEIISGIKLGDTKTLLLVDGNYFNTYTIFNKEKGKFETLDHVCVKGGDNTFSSIAAASILAKVERDAYIEELCEKYPYLVERYSLDSNKGYGAKAHLDGIKEYGITEWHRKTFGICKTFL
jgi:ribonuclease HII